VRNIRRKTRRSINLTKINKAHSQMTVFNIRIQMTESRRDIKTSIRKMKMSQCQIAVRRKMMKSVFPNIKKSKTRGIKGNISCMKLSRRLMSHFPSYLTLRTLLYLQLLLPPLALHEGIQFILFF
jgi:hypothetical protein